MNYHFHYQHLMDRAPKIKVKDEYRERHHIIPKCIWTGCDDSCPIGVGKHSCGLDDMENIAYLTPEEHYVAHQLLVKIHPMYENLKYALWAMGGRGAHKHRRNKIYGWVRRLRQNMEISPETRAKMSAAKIGKLPWNYGIKKVKIAQIAKKSGRKPGSIPWNAGRTSQTDSRIKSGYKRNWSVTTEEGCKKTSITLKNRILVINNIKVSCITCHKVLTLGNIIRHHEACRPHQRHPNWSEESRATMSMRTKVKNAMTLRHEDGKFKKVA